MDLEIQAVRAALVEKRDAFQRAIEAFDAALGLAGSAPSTGTPKKAQKRTQGPHQRAARSLPDVTPKNSEALLCRCGCGKPLPPRRGPTPGRGRLYATPLCKSRARAATKEAP